MSSSLIFRCTTIRIRFFDHAETNMSCSFKNMHTFLRYNNYKTNRQIKYLYVLHFGVEIHPFLLTR